MTDLTPFTEKINGALTALSLSCLQVNLGKLCNQACKHCHVDAGPKRTEIMDAATVDDVINAVRLLRPKMVDITGGAPEMNPHFRELVIACRELGVEQIIDRCNLTILSEPGYEWVADFLAQNKVEVCASLPFYEADLVDRQRGRGVFDGSLKGLAMLNQRGYGSTLPLNLVYNPQGAYMAPDQSELEQVYKRRLGELGISFNHLFTITNMPIARFKSFLERSGNYTRYMNKLIGRFNQGTLGSLMCRSLISVGYDGRLYDCDFNQMLDMEVAGEVRHIGRIHELVQEGRPIRVDNHCYGCTAGGGSSCGGALESEATVISV